MVSQGCTDDGTVVRVSGDVDIATAPGLQRQLLGLIETDHRVVIDLADVEFMDCSGLGVLLTCQQRAVTVGAVLVLRRPSHRVTRLLELTALKPQFTIEATPLPFPAQR